MATASPTPHGLYQVPRRPPSRPYLRDPPARPNLKRGSPLPLHTSIGPISSERQYSGDSSDDDEGSAPLLSAEAEALLSEELKAAKEPGINLIDSRGVDGARVAVELSSGSPLSRGAARVASWKRDARGQPIAAAAANPRVIRLSIGSPRSGHLRRTASTSSVQSGSPLIRHLARESTTPAPLASSELASVAPKAEHESSVQGYGAGKYPSESRSVHSTELSVLRSMGASNTSNAAKEEMGVHNSMKVTRFNKVSATGGFLKGPARRGIVRRQSDEDPAPAPEALVWEEHQAQPLSHELDHQNDQRPPEPKDADLLVPHVHRLELEPHIFTERAPIAQDIPMTEAEHTPPSTGSKSSSGKRVVPIFNVKAPPLPSLPSRFDQENHEPPPTFKKNKADMFSLMDRPPQLAVHPVSKPPTETPMTVSPARNVLGPRSRNTPLRPAPPPPKMSMIDTVTSTAGAAASESKKKRTLVTVNGKQYQRLEILGRGGSAKVYRVMAANWKILALKRVSLEEADEMAMRGFKGEIDLLRKLEKVERVVNLYDYEINEERQTLSILMELGESDFNRVLTGRINAENARFDITFTRFFWQEMLECVQAVHAHDVIHSDLKPANFLLFKDKLKLIDFGIANAIQDDTVNVHRDHQVGTPNYISPEALVDFNVAHGKPSTAGVKLMKLGKPSDVWSLGCILYQMAYGRPPFAHLPSSMQKMMAIPNPHHVIEFPPRGLGGTLVPLALIRTLKRCLTRDPKLRPTTEELLAADDPFLHPDLLDQRLVPVSKDLLASIHRVVAAQVKKNGAPNEADVARWAEETFARLRRSADEGRVW